MAEMRLTEVERREFEQIEDSGDTQGLAWRVSRVKAEVVVAVRVQIEGLAGQWEREARNIPRTGSQVGEGVRAAMIGDARELRALAARLCVLVKESVDE